MRVLFILKQMGYIRHFTPVVRALAGRGDTVRLAAQDADRKPELPDALQGLETLSLTTCDRKRRDEWRDYVSLLRRSADYLRYLTPPFADARKLRARAFEKLVRTLSNGVRDPRPGEAEIALALTTEEQDRLRRVLQMVGEVIPADCSLRTWLQTEAPDVVLITPLIDLGSSQAEYVKACRAVGIPVVMLLFSWDNLSTKGLIHELPDAVLVWNDRQVQEAVELHGVPRDRLVVTGAPRFDEFFALRPSIGRDDFCRHFGFDPGEAIVLYLGSSKFVTNDEQAFIRRWIDAVRATPTLAGANILVKPHPDLNRAWGNAGERVSWTAPSGEVRLRVTRPFDVERVTAVRTAFHGAQFLYDRLHHAAAAVGLNTSAEIEAAIVGRPVLTIKVPDELADGQTGTLHFHYLLREHGGFVESASTLDEHCESLARAVAGDVDHDRIRRFVRDFVRPAGLDAPATDAMVKAIGRVVKRSRKRRQAVTDAGVADPAATPATADSQSAPDDVIALDYAPVSVRLRVTSREERRWRARACAKEPWTVEWIERVVDREVVLYDIGANVGAFSLIAARRQPLATVVAFEPGYASFARLCENIVLNCCQQIVIPISVQLWSRTELVALKYRSLAPGQSRHALGSWRPRRRGIPREGRYEQPMLGMRLDDLARQYALPPPTAVKLDVDGAGFQCVNRIERHKSRAPLYAEFRRG